MASSVEVQQVCGHYRRGPAGLWLVLQRSGSSVASCASLFTEGQVCSTVPLALFSRADTVQSQLHRCAKHSVIRISFPGQWLGYLGFPQKLLSTRQSFDNIQTLNDNYVQNAHCGNITFCGEASLKFIIHNIPLKVLK